MSYPAAKIPSDAPRETSGAVLPMFRLPPISVRAYCESADSIASLKAAFADRRMSRTQCTVQPGGIATATATHRQARSPNLLIVESHATGAGLFEQLEALAEVCDVETKLLVVGGANDIALYRELLARGVSDYLVSPLDPAGLIGAIARLYREPGAKKLGRSLAFVGAKGGVGSSTIAHNVAATMARLYGSVILMDLDLPFGSAGVGFNLDAAPGMEQAIEDAGRVDDVLLERLAIKRGDNLRILATPAILEHGHDAPEGAFERVLDVGQSSAQFVVLDVPHVWTPWARKTLLAADQVVITATPDLVSLRNAGTLVELLRQQRPNDAPPKLVLNQVGIPKRSEISADKFAEALQLQPIASIPFEPAPFSTAAIAGKTVTEIASKAAAGAALDRIAAELSGIKPKDEAKRPFSLMRLLGR